MRVLVTGGAGYVGSHAVLELVRAGHEVAVFDNLQSGHRWAVPPGIPLAVVDLVDARGMARALDELGPFDAALHFAALTRVDESVARPEAYFHVNVAGTLGLLAALSRRGTRYVVFSSSAAVYGEPRTVPIPESHPLTPTNPYGESKRMVEAMLPWFEQAHGIKWVSLRYFNAAGADPAGATGEDHTPETHLIPSVLLVALGLRPGPVRIFGTDYPTQDGTCVRDFVHVSDLATAHKLALEYLAGGGASDVFNLGSGQGYTVREVIAACREVVASEGGAPEDSPGAAFEVIEAPRRPGDPAVLVASNEKAGERLGWQPRPAQLREMVHSAWNWHRRQHGRADVKAVPAD